MATGDFPDISASTYGTAASAVNMMQMVDSPIHSLRRLQNNLGVQNFQNQPTPPIAPIAKKENVIMSSRRLVQVFIADPHESVPLDKSLIYCGEQKLTDATDQELFFEIDIKSILEKHNTMRIKLVDKKVKERTEYLEPVKIRDLKMVVVTVAQF